MMSKKLLSIFIAALLFFSSIVFFTGLKIPWISASLTTPPSDWPSVFFCGEDVFVCTKDNPILADVGETVSIALVVFNLTDVQVPDPSYPTEKRSLGNLAGFDVQFSWDPEILNLTGYNVTVPVESYPNPVSPSPYAGILYEPVMELAVEVNGSLGTAWIGYASYSPVVPFNGNGTIITMSFNVTKRGATDLKLTSVALSDSNGRPLLWHQYDGFFHTPGAPVANFTFWPDVGVVNKTVIFDASASYSPLGFDIVNYTWNFGDGNITTVNTPTINHTYSSTGTYTVSLRVTDSEGTVSSEATKVLSIVEKRNVKVSSVIPQAERVLVNRTLGVSVTVKNDGRADEACNITLYYNASTVDFDDLSATSWVKVDEKTNVTLTLAKPEVVVELSWNTSGVTADAFYYIMANVTQVPYEADHEDNTGVSSKPVWILSSPLRDIAITKFLYGWESGVFYHPVLSGEKSTIAITILNYGTEPESNINVTLYLNETIWHSWTLNLTYGESTTLKWGEILPVNIYNVTAEAIILEDNDIRNNNGTAILRVIAPPQLNFTYPKPVYVNQNITLDATASHHAEPDANITNYKWEVWAPGGTTPQKTFSGTDANVIAYAFGETGHWRVTLIVTDSFGITYDSTRPFTSAYRLEATILVESTPGFPLEYIIIIVVVAVAAAGTIVYIGRRRRKAKV
jgi:PKD repeat protein